LLYRQHFGTIPLKVTGNSPQKEVQGTLLVDKPEKPSGSETYPLDVMAALSSDNSTITVSIINPTYTDQEIDISFSGVNIKQGGTLYTIISPSLTAVNRPENNPRVSIVENKLESTPGTFKIAPLSINLYEFGIN
jgi:alpha-L-arabinofuranosidase